MSLYVPSAPFFHLLSEICPNGVKRFQPSFLWAGYSLGEFFVNLGMAHGLSFNEFLYHGFGEASFPPIDLDVIELPVTTEPMDSFHADIELFADFLRSEKTFHRPCLSIPVMTILSLAILNFP
jgi:hypothetical protein